MKSIAMISLLAALAGGGFFADAQHSFAQSLFAAQPLKRGDTVPDIEKLASELYSAVKQEDRISYESAMTRLINQANVAGVLHVLFPPDRKRNIFHAMAGVQSPEAQEFFAKEMESLIQILRGDSSQAIELGGVKIKFPYLRDILPGETSQAFNRASMGTSVDFPQEAISALSNELSRRKNGSFVDFIQILYARNDRGYTILDILPQAVVTPIIGPAEELSRNIAQLSERVKKNLQEKALAQSKNEFWSLSDAFVFHAKQPIDIAVKAGNAPAFRVLESAGASPYEISSNIFIGVLGGVLVGSAAQSFFHLNHPFDTGNPLDIVALLPFYGSVPLINGCRAVVRRAKINWMLKKSSGGSASAIAAPPFPMPQ